MFCSIALYSCRNAAEPELNPETVQSGKVTCPTASTKNGRFAFSSTKNYFETSRKLSKLNPRQLQQWSERFEVKSLNSSTRLAAKGQKEEEIGWDYIPPAVKALLNEKGEMLIGDTIVWYHKGKRHFFPKEDENELNRVKNNPESGKSHGFYSFTRVEDKKGKKTNSTPIPAPANWLNAGIFYYPPDGRYQYIQYYGEDNQRWKFVNELYSYNEWTQYTGYYYFATSLYLIMKMQKPSGPGWYDENGVRREINFNIIATTRKIWNLVWPTFTNPTVTEYDWGYYVFNNELDPYENRLFVTNYWLEIAYWWGWQCDQEYCGVGVGNGTPVWQVNIYGSIRQRRDQHPSTGLSWDCIANPLWYKKRYTWDGDPE